MCWRTLRIVAASSILIGVLACDGDDAATSVSEVRETTAGSVETDTAGTNGPSANTESDTTTPTTPRDFEIVEASTMWEPVLEGVTASPAPAAEACDSTSAAGDIEIPEFMQTGYHSTTFGGPWTSWFAAFDPTTRSVIVLGQGYDGTGNARRLVAGSLDVCTDSWSPISTVLQHPRTGRAAHPTAMAYDVDSDALTVYTTEGVFVHDSELDEWHHHAVPRDDDGWVEYFVLSAVYHPASGMIIAADGVQLLAHDVDTDEWWPITSLGFDPGAGDFLGVNAAMDRFVIGVAGTGRNDESTWLADPLSGEAMVVRTPEHAHVNLVWRNEAFGSADGTVFVTHGSTGEVCGFDAETLAWNRCVTSSTGEPGPGSAIVGDPVNDRLIAISTTDIEAWPLPQP